MRKRWERWQRKAVAEPEYVPAVRLYAGIFTKLDGEEYAVIEKNKDILVAAWKPGIFLMSRMFIHFYRDQSRRERDRHGPVNGAISMCAAIILAISGADYCCYSKYIQYIFRSYLFAVGHVFVCKRGLRLHTDEKDRCDWLGRYMKTVMRKCGFDAELYTKPQDYEGFFGIRSDLRSVVVFGQQP